MHDPSARRLLDIHIGLPTRNPISDSNPKSNFKSSNAPNLISVGALLQTLLRIEAHSAPQDLSAGISGPYF